jgi:hypothetical protein
MPEKKKSDAVKSGAKYMVYAAVVGLIVIIAFIIGTVVGFYANMQLDPGEETCEPIECPNQYQCKPGEVCDFNTCEVCTTKTWLRVS